MKFVSKIKNYSVTLRNGIPSEHLTGRPAIAGLYVRFKEGVAEVNDEEMVRLMLQNPYYKKDFFSSEEGERDPFALSRTSSEPVHQLMNMEYGHVGVSHNMKQPPRDINKVIMEIATDMAKKMAPEMAKEILQTMTQQSKEVTSAAQVEEFEPPKGTGFAPNAPEYKNQAPEVEKKRQVRHPKNNPIAPSGPAAAETL